jgi:hypothetical protein
LGPKKLIKNFGDLTPYLTYVQVEILEVSTPGKEKVVMEFPAPTHTPATPVKVSIYLLDIVG